MCNTVRFSFSKCTLFFIFIFTLLLLLFNMGPIDRHYNPNYASVLEKDKWGPRASSMTVCQATHFLLDRR